LVFVEFFEGFVNAAAEEGFDSCFFGLFELSRYWNLYLRGSFRRWLGGSGSRWGIGVDRGDVVRGARAERLDGSEIVSYRVEKRAAECLGAGWVEVRQVRRLAA